MRAYKVPEIQNVRTILDSFDFMLVVFNGVEIEETYLFFGLSKIMPFLGAKETFLKIF